MRARSSARPLEPDPAALSLTQPGDLSSAAENEQSKAVLRQAKEELATLKSEVLQIAEEVATGAQLARSQEACCVPPMLTSAHYLPDGHDRLHSAVGRYG